MQHVQIQHAQNVRLLYVLKVKQSRYRHGGFQEVKVPRFRDNGTGWW